MFMSTESDELCFFDASLQKECSCRQLRERNCAGALNGKELFIIEGSKTGAQLRDNPGGARKNG